ncbi:hypothetical protein [Pseudobacteriovorax antillogorgiicola]|uniref:Uncharacterized protein n=1 Tax=Pseudobacteriovorax antillogorgiicola TaxID=1513793 RepID=A0A1Y6CKD7_9BACT|nr:hypothetical protein [Pseudobacteriovorax antillogorgiicola]TCS45926.1 hypothetical protein EDD56_12689 [Pseudobacteriovorax antillogorgiicola]SMF71025.1 hypothetical protein SAMN06296036_1269 [Pseudobacteriovorax antillogorgiicola]
MNLDFQSVIDKSKVSAQKKIETELNQFLFQFIEKQIIEARTTLKQANLALKNNSIDKTISLALGRAYSLGSPSVSTPRKA